jgi:hypothetical protein
VRGFFSKLWRAAIMAFEDDRNTLSDILRFVKRVLDELVTGRISEDKELFQSAWTAEVRPRLEGLIEGLGNIQNQNDTLWIQLQNHGLTGEQLKLKRKRLAAISAKGVLKRILDIINTILGSIPGAEPVKEFKEFVEEGIDDPNASIAARFI